MLPFFMFTPEQLPLEEITIAQLKGKMSAITQKYRKVRQSLKGQESKVAQVVDFKFPGTWIFLTEATYRFDTQVVDPRTLSAKFKNSNVYAPTIEVVDFSKWIDNKYLDLGAKELQRIMMEADVRLWCDCPSFHYQGFNYKLAQLGAAIHPTSIPDEIWRGRHGSQGLVCKHWGGLLPYMSTFYSYIMINKLKDRIKRTGIPKAYRGSAYP